MSNGIINGRELLKDVLRERLNVKKKLELESTKGMSGGRSYRRIDLAFCGGDKIAIPDNGRVYLSSRWLDYSEDITFKHRTYRTHIIIDENKYVTFNVKIKDDEAKRFCGTRCYECFGWRNECIARSVIQSYLTGLTIELKKESRSSVRRDCDERDTLSSCNVTESPESSLDEEDYDTDGPKSDDVSSDEDYMDETHEDNDVNDEVKEVVEPTSLTSEDVHGGPECEQDIPDSQSENPEGSGGFGTAGKGDGTDSLSSSFDQRGSDDSDVDDRCSPGQDGDPCDGCRNEDGRDDHEPAGNDASEWLHDDVIDTFERIGDNGIKEHRHEGYDYWHPVSRVHVDDDHRDDSRRCDVRYDGDDAHEWSAGYSDLDRPEGELCASCSGNEDVWEMMDNPCTPNHSYGGGGAQAKALTANDSNNVKRTYVTLLLRRFFSSLEDIFSKEYGFDKWSGKKVIRSCIADPGDLPNSKYKFAKSNDMLLFVDVSGSVSHLSDFIASMIMAACDGQDITVVVGSEAHPEKVLKKEIYARGLFNWRDCPVEREYEYIRNFEDQVDIFVRDWKPMVGSTIVVWSDYMDINIKNWKKLERVFKGFNVVFLCSHDADVDSDYKGNESFDVETFARKNGYVFLWGINSVGGIKRAIKELSLNVKGNKR